MDHVDSMGPDLQPVRSPIFEFPSRKGITTVDISRHSYGHIFRYCVTLQSHGGYAGSPTRTVYVGVTLTRSKIKVNLSGLLNF